ncbi:hypothetical protein [Reichenbachiella sp.]|uniref:hypothetical protein n=1 Tax=Reichenbachiella sp. TaxID=2184521 RepID=UPI003BB0FD22
MVLNDDAKKIEFSFLDGWNLLMDEIKKIQDNGIMTRVRIFDEYPNHQTLLTFFGSKSWRV